MFFCQYVSLCMPKFQRCIFIEISKFLACIFCSCHFFLAFGNNVLNPLYFDVRIWREWFVFHRDGWSRCSFLWWLACAAGRPMGLPLPRRHHTTAIGSIFHGLYLCIRVLNHGFLWIFGIAWIFLWFCF